MLYPTNIKRKKVNRKEKIKKSVNNFISNLKYLLFDREDLFEILAAKLHI